MNIERSDDYEEMAAGFQCLQIQTLHTVLVEQGIPLVQVRSICEGFARNFGIILDQYWFDAGGDKVIPIIGFTSESKGSSDRLLLNGGQFSFAEHASGNLYWYFDQHDPKSVPLKCGRRKNEN
jgi:hypothetical protein